MDNPVYDAGKTRREFYVKEFAGMNIMCIMLWSLKKEKGQHSDIQHLWRDEVDLQSRIKMSLDNSFWQMVKINLAE